MAIAPVIASSDGSALAQLRAFTETVVDSAKFADLQDATDVTTNPSLLFQAVQAPASADLVKETVAAVLAEHKGRPESEVLDALVIRLTVAFVKKIMTLASGLVSFEVDPELSFDEEATYTRAKQMLAEFERAGVEKKRLLVKIASTWEGIQAAARLEKEGVHCNLTLIFSFYQALACAQAGAFLISPFVGRITDWYKKAETKDGISPTYTAESDPGVIAVRKIYNYFRKHGLQTVVMGASFRNADQVKGLSGCDKLTIPPSIIETLKQETPKSPLARVLAPETAAKTADAALPKLDEKTFRWHLNEDAMATEKLAEGIRNFNKDWLKLKALLKTEYLK